MKLAFKIIQSNFRTVLNLAWIRLAEHPMRAAGLVMTLCLAILAWIVLAALASLFLTSEAGKAINTDLSITNARTVTDVQHAAVWSK